MNETRLCRSGPNWLALVTLLSTGGLLSACGSDPLVCGPGTKLVQAADGSQSCEADVLACQPGQVKVTGEDGIEVCQSPINNPCANVTCNAADFPQWAASTLQLLPEQVNETTCSCLPSVCNEGFQLHQGSCLPRLTEQDCAAFGPGYVPSGTGLCLPCDDCTCEDQPGSLACIPVRCEDAPQLATQQNDPNSEYYGRRLCLEDPAPPVQSCVNNCHNGIEDPHPWFGGDDLTCTGCHGGDGAATTRETAHIPIPAIWQANSTQWGRPNLQYYWNYNTLFGVENFEGGLAWLRFRNPGDLRIADQSCGKLAGCHQDRVENQRRSVMATEVGLTGVALGRNGLARSVIRGQGGLYKWDTTEGMALGWGRLEVPEHNPYAYNAEYVGSMQRITGFTMQNREFNGNYNQTEILKEIYDKQCGDCHLGNAGANNRYADFRSSGCSACHMPYALDGRSRSTDQMIKKDEPTYPNAYNQIANFNANDLQNLNGAWLGPERAHPSKHRLSKQMTSQKCGTCHVGSNRTDWQFRGYRFDPNRDAVTAIDNNRLVAGQDIIFTDEIDNNADANARYHGAAQNQILKYEDWNQDGYDDSPADIHFQAGLECLDCHTSGEMHNELKFVKVAKVTDWSDRNQVNDMSGAIWSHMSQATEVECVSCHGNLEYRALGYYADNRNPVKNLVVCPEPGEQIADYEKPAECDNLGAGRWLRSKFTGRHHYVTQVRDTVANYATGGGSTRPNGAPVYSLVSSIFHGRVDNDPLNGVGPCVNGNANTCYKDQANNQLQIRQGFSHLGRPAVNSNDQMAGGLECYACHSTWQMACQGCHLNLADNDGNQILRDYSRSTGELTYGAIVHADFTYIDPLAIQLGINPEGKISQFEPETKQAIRHVDANNQDFFGTRVIVNNDANIVYNVYRNRAGYGLRQYNTELVGLPPNSDGPDYEQDARMDQNAGEGFQPFMPHTTQRSHPLMDCATCHIDVNNANADAVTARYGVNPNGFANVSGYLAILDGLQIIRNNSNQAVNVDQAAGFRLDADIDPDAFVINRQLDWVVFDDGFPLSYTNHPIKQGFYNLYTDPFYQRQYPRLAQVAGPLNQALLQLIQNEIKVANVGVQYKAIR